MNVISKKVFFTAFAAIALAVACIFIVTVFINGKDDSAGAYSAEQRSDTVAASRDDMCNILLLGLDSEAGLCDVMMLVGINKTKGSVTVVQIPRDTYAEYTQASYKKLNGAYSSLDGAEQTAEFLSNAFGVEIHHYACIDLDTFGNVVDALGGVDIELSRDMKYTDAEQGLYIDLKKGTTHLDGEAARQFVRFRSGYADGDLGRIDAQKLFMAAFFQKLTESFSPISGARLASALDGVETDLGVSDMISIGTEILEMDSDSVYMITLPGKEAVAAQSGASYYVISRDACADIFKQYFGATRDFDSQQKFLNKRYSNFESIYLEYAEFSVIPVSEIVSDATRFVT